MPGVLELHVYTRAPGAAEALECPRTHDERWGSLPPDEPVAQFSCPETTFWLQRDGDQFALVDAITDAVLIRLSLRAPTHVAIWPAPPPDGKAPESAAYAAQAFSTGAEVGAFYSHTSERAKEVSTTTVTEEPARAGPLFRLAVGALSVTGSETTPLAPDLNGLPSDHLPDAFSGGAFVLQVHAAWPRHAAGFWLDLLDVGVHLDIGGGKVPVEYQTRGDAAERFTRTHFGLIGGAKLRAQWIRQLVTNEWLQPEGDLNWDAAIGFEGPVAMGSWINGRWDSEGRGVARDNNYPAFRALDDFFTDGRWWIGAEYRVWRGMWVGLKLYGFDAFWENHQDHVLEGNYADRFRTWGILATFTPMSFDGARRTETVVTGDPTVRVRPARPIVRRPPPEPPIQFTRLPLADIAAWQESIDIREIPTGRAEIPSEADPTVDDLIGKIRRRQEQDKRSGGLLEYSLRAEGGADSRGPEVANENLGLQRAHDAIVRFRTRAVEGGVTLTLGAEEATSLGERQPLDFEGTVIPREKCKPTAYPRRPPIDSTTRKQYILWQCPDRAIRKEGLDRNRHVRMTVVGQMAGGRLDAPRAVGASQRRVDQNVGTALAKALQKTLPEIVYEPQSNQILIPLSGLDTRILRRQGQVFDRTARALQKRFGKASLGALIVVRNDAPPADSRTDSNTTIRTAFYSFGKGFALAGGLKVMKGETIARIAAFALAERDRAETLVRREREVQTALASVRGVEILPIPLGTPGQAGPEDAEVLHHLVVSNQRRQIEQEGKPRPAILLIDAAARATNAEDAAHVLGNAVNSATDKVWGIFPMRHDTLRTDHLAFLVFATSPLIMEESGDPFVREIEAWVRSYVKDHPPAGGNTRRRPRTAARQSNRRPQPRASSAAD